MFRKRTQVSFSSRSSHVPGMNWIDRFQISQRNQVSDAKTEKPLSLSTCGSQLKLLLGSFQVLLLSQLLDEHGDG